MMDGLVKRKKKKNTGDFGFWNDIKIIHKFILLYFFKNERFTFKHFWDINDTKILLKYKMNIILIW